jgi:predicted  nucleic acid-binding Zn-ribbon protein
VPDGLAEDLARAQGDLERLRAEYRAKEAEIEQIRAKYDADRERFRELSTSEAS